MAKTKQQKREEARIRQEEWDALSLDEKIKRVKASPGESKRQLKKLYKHTGS